MGKIKCALESNISVRCEIYLAYAKARYKKVDVKTFIISLKETTFKLTQFRMNAVSRPRKHKELAMRCWIKIIMEDVDGWRP